MISDARGFGAVALAWVGLAAVAPSPPPARAEELGFVRMLVVASPTIRGSLLDGDLMRQVILEGTGGNCEFRYLQETKETTPQEIFAAIDRLRVQPHETLVFYYSGHGATRVRTGEPAEHFLYLDSGQTILRKELRAYLLAQRPRLAVLITDSCSGASVERKRLFPLRTPRLRDNEQLDRGLFRALFLEPAGLVDVTAASYYPERQYGELAWFDYDGGLFTTALYSSFYMSHADLVGKARRRRPTPREDNVWAVFLDAVAELTQERYRDYKARMLAPDSDFTDEDRKALTEQETQVPHRFGIPESRVGLASVHGPGHFALGIQVVQARDAARQPSGVSFVARTPQARDPAILRLQPGDRILAVNERPVRTREEFADLVDALDCRRPATMTILDVNSGRSLTIQVKSHCQP